MVKITIRNRIIHLQKSLKTDRFIAVAYNNAEYHPKNFEFYLDDADEFLNNQILDRQLESEHNYNIKGIKCIRLGFGEEK